MKNFFRLLLTLLCGLTLAYIAYWAADQELTFLHYKHDAGTWFTGASTYQWAWLGLGTANYLVILAAGFWIFRKGKEDVSS